MCCAVLSAAGFLAVSVCGGICAAVSEEKTDESPFRGRLRLLRTGAAALRLYPAALRGQADEVERTVCCLRGVPGEAARSVPGGRPAYPEIGGQRSYPEVRGQKSEVRK